jgi:Flp pilus assembly protein TadG
MLKRLFVPPNVIRILSRDRGSSVALEFAFIAPILVAMLLGVFEIANAALFYEELQNAAHSIPASASNLAVQGDGSTSLTYAQIQLAESEIWGEIPELETGFEDGAKSVTISSVAFIPTLPPASAAATAAHQATCTPSKANSVTCAYTPTVIWSVAYAGGDSGRTFNQVYRSCTGAPSVGGQSNATVQNTTGTGSAFVALPGGLNNEAPPTAGIKASTAPTWQASDLTSLPTYVVADKDPNLAPPSPILVVDIHVVYTPIFGLFIGKSGISFYATGFWPVRSVKSSVIVGTGNNATTQSLSLSEQFTTISTVAADIGANGVPTGTLTNAPGGYCINHSAYLSPAAAVLNGTS